MSTGQPGDKIATVVVVNPEMIVRVPNAEKHVADVASKRFGDLCTPQGLMAVDQELVWVRTVEEMMFNGLGKHVENCPEDFLSYGFVAYAAFGTPTEEEQP